MSARTRTFRFLSLVFVGALLLQGVTICQVLQTEGRRKVFEEVKAKAEKGDAEAQCVVGVLYSTGYGVKENQAEATKWFRKAAEQGNPDAQSSLGNCYSKGKGVKQNYVEAVKWNRKAAEQGDVAGRAMLGSMYVNGDGVKRNCVEAYAWWNLDTKTHEAVGECLDSLQKQMSPQQIADAQKRTKELKALIEGKMKQTSGTK